jgi:3-oxoacyl-[acyl-carrier-protein] synthase-3
MGVQFIQTGAHKKVLIIGADVMTSILDFKDRATCVLFGDAAGRRAAEPSTDDTGFIDLRHEVDGSAPAYLHMLAAAA